ncbi:hypothetical protein ACIHCV_31860 [Streptomyces sp. NPDC051956]|uniref:hypothetical protein n=1 Tax=Streptomyces sp. NPDC051956 TaxID=3365677 RepID=UPI0037D6F73C
MSSAAVQQSQLLSGWGDYFGAVEAEESLLHTALRGTYLPLLEGTQDLLRELAGRGTWLKALRRAVDPDDLIIGGGERGRRGPGRGGCGGS